MIFFFVQVVQFDFFYVLDWCSHKNLFVLKCLYLLGKYRNFPEYSLRNSVISILVPPVRLSCMYISFTKRTLQIRRDNLFISTYVKTNTFPIAIFHFGKGVVLRNRIAEKKDANVELNRSTCGRRSKSCEKRACTELDV